MWWMTTSQSQHHPKICFFNVWTGLISQDWKKHKEDQVTLFGSTPQTFEPEVRPHYFCCGDSWFSGGTDDETKLKDNKLEVTFPND